MNPDRLYELLPAIYRLRDADQGEPLRALLAILAEQAAVLEENLAQLYDDWFIETCAPWVVPYIGDLVGHRALHAQIPVSGGIASAPRASAPAIGSPRAEVANTIGYRRRKGTASMLEQLAHDVTGWDARVVEFFQTLATTQYMNHIRPDHAGTPDLRRVELLEKIGTPFDTVAHTADVRRIARRRGKYNIPNIGIFLWRIAEYSLTRSPAHPVDDATRFTFNPVGISAPLFNDAVPEADAVGLATERGVPVGGNVPAPLARRRLAREKGRYYGPGLSILVEMAPRQPDGAIDPSAEPIAIPAEDVIVCDLSDVGADWAHTPVAADKVAVDPELGRLAFAQPPDGVVLVTYRYGSVAPLGGGEYERADTFSKIPDRGKEALQPVIPVAMPDRIGDALPAASGAVEIQDSGRYEETLAITLAAGQRLELRARNGARPALILGGELTVTGGAGSDLTLNGLLIAGGAVRVTGELRTLRMVHCTLVPGIAVGPDGAPTAPSSPSLIVESAGTQVEIVDSICGPLEIHEDATASIENSIVDALSDDAMAYSAAGGRAGGELTVVNSTLIGRVHARTLPLASDSIFLARVPDGAPEEPRLYPLQISRRQEGCLRFCYAPPGSRTPRRHKCQPDEDATPDEQTRVRPQFTSLRYGDPGYGQLSTRSAPEIATGASDGSELGAFHNLFARQRESNLRVRLDEYLRFGLEAGIFYVS